MKTGANKPLGQRLAEHRALRVPALAALAALLAGVVVALAPVPRPMPPLDSLSRAHLSALPARMDPVRVQPYCTLVWNLPAVAPLRSLGSCGGTVGSQVAAGVVNRYGGHVLGAQLATVTLSVARGLHAVDSRPIWVLSVDRYLSDLPGWTDDHRDCSPGRVLVLVDASKGKPIGELSWGRSAPPSPGAPCSSSR